jgi:hypothetical protein
MISALSGAPGARAELNENVRRYPRRAGKAHGPLPALRGPGTFFGTQESDFARVMSALGRRAGEGS